MPVSPHASVPVDVAERHFLFFDPTVFEGMRRHFLDHMDRRGLGVRGHSGWLMAVIIDGLDREHVPDVSPVVLDLGCRRVVRWAPGVHRRLTTFWETHLRFVPDHRYGHSLWVNQVTREALDDHAEVADRQLRLPGIPPARPRRQRVARYPVGDPDRRYLR